MTPRKDRMTLHERDGVTVLDLGKIEIWDGADLALLRETLFNQIEKHKCRSIGVDMRAVKYIPSGFFGMLFDWHEKGIQIYLYSPQPNVAQMLWFRQFFDHVCDGCHLLLGEPKQQLVVPHPVWNNADKDSRWRDEEQSESVATTSRK